MRPVSLALIVALALSVAAHAFLVLRSSSGASSALTLSSAGAAGSSAAGAPAGPEAADARTSTQVAADGTVSIPGAGAALLRAGDLAALKAHFEALGFPPEMVRALVSAALWRSNSSRVMQLQRRMWNQDTAAADYWRGGRPGDSNRLTAEERTELRRLQRENQDKLRSLFGDEADTNDWQRGQLAFLPGEKRDAISAIERDYNELRQELQMDMAGFSLPADQEKMRFLQEEQRRDLASVLTPEELRAYELRTSPTAQQMRWRYSDTFQSEEEYAAVFDLQRAFDEKWNPQLGLPGGRPPRNDPSYWQERQAAEKTMHEQLAGLIGADRVTELQRAQDNEYQQLRGAARRFNLPAETIKSVYALKDTVATASQQLAEDPALTPEQRTQRAAQLVEKTRAQIRSALGTEVADAYLANNMRWLDEVAKGRTLRVQPNGNTSLSSPPKPATPAPAPGTTKP